MCFIHVLHVLYMPMDASLACWALFCFVFFLREKESGDILISLMTSIFSDTSARSRRSEIVMV